MAKKIPEEVTAVVVVLTEPVRGQEQVKRLLETFRFFTFVKDAQPIAHDVTAEAIGYSRGVIDSARVMGEAWRRVLDLTRSKE